MLTKAMAEQSTGCRENATGLGKFYGHGGIYLKDDKAGQELLACREIEVPNAGAGSYTEVFRRLGFPQVEVYEQSSSAGDWVFGVFDGSVWRCAFQVNRYPYHGFTYKLGGSLSVFKTFDDLSQYLES